MSIITKFNICYHAFESSHLSFALCLYLFTIISPVLIEHIMEERYSTWSIVLCTIELPQWAQCVFACEDSIVWPSYKHDVNI